MYSVVLMVAMTGAGDVPANGFLRGGGCCGGSYSSCCGTSSVYSSCTGYSSSCCGYSSGCCGYSSGCCGGSSCHGGGLFKGGLFRGHSCHGSSCCGGGCYGGGCYGGSVYSPSTGCYGGSSYYSGCTGSMSYSSGCVGMGAPMMSTTEAMPAYSSAPIVTGDAVSVPKVEEKKANDKKDEKKDDKKDDKKDLSSAKATIIVNLPENAVLTVDGQVTKATSARRVFTSPVLEQDKDYYYDLKAEFKRDGKPMQVSKRVIIRAGVETVVDIRDDAAVAVVAK